jgi:uncharacterized protein (TIGR00106 family)
MKVVADICVIPISGSVSLRKEVAHAHQVLKDTGLPVQLHGYGTNIEGDFDTVMGAVKKIHSSLHEAGIPRISTTIKLGSRTDKEQGIADKIEAVQQILTEEQ